MLFDLQKLLGINTIYLNVIKKKNKKKYFIYNDHDIKQRTRKEK